MTNDFLKGKKILIAEDDFVSQKLIAHSMHDTGAIFDIVGNGKEAIEHLMLGTYDLVIMDINMPEMDGFEATEYIRKKMQMTIPIIAMTGWSSKEDIEKFEQVGMNGKLLKPFGLDILYKTLNEAFMIKKSYVMATAQRKEAVLEDKIPHVDFSLLNELSESDSAYKKTIIQMFLDAMPETIQQIEDAFAIKDYDALAKAAHYAKSTLSVIKVEVLRTLVARIEMNCKKNEHLDELETLVKKISVKYDLCVQTLRDELKKD